MRAELLKRRKALYEAKWPETKKPQGGHPKKNSEMISPFSEDTAAKTNQTARTIQQEIQIATALSDEVKETLRDTKVADNKTELLRLSRLKPEQQQQVATRLREGTSRGVKQAKVAIQAEAAAAYSSSRGGVALTSKWRNVCSSSTLSKSK